MSGKSSLELVRVGRRSVVGAARPRGRSRSRRTHLGGGWVLLVALGCGEPAEPTAPSVIRVGGHSGAAGAGGASEAGTAGTAAVAACLQRVAESCSACTCSPEGSLTCSPLVPNPVCAHGGLSVPEGTSLPSLLDCNTCTCLPIGPCPQDAEMSCSQLDCASGCTYAGRTYPEGVWFPATDGCNECSCLEGQAICSQTECACDPDREPWRDYAGATAEACTGLPVACPAGSAPFTNVCGCGCEQSPECPAEANCERVLLEADPVIGVPAHSRCADVVVCPLTRDVQVR